MQKNINEDLLTNLIIHILMRDVYIRHLINFIFLHLSISEFSII